MSATLAAQDITVTGPAGGIFADELFTDARGEATRRPLVRDVGCLCCRACARSTRTDPRVLPSRTLPKRPTGNFGARASDGRSSRRQR